MRDPVEVWLGAEPAGRDGLGPCWLRAMPWNAAVDMAAVPGHLLPTHPCCAEGGRKAAHPCHRRLARSGSVSAAQGWHEAARQCEGTGAACGSSGHPDTCKGREQGVRGLLRTSNVWQSVDAGG